MKKVKLYTICYCLIVSLLAMMTSTNVNAQESMLAQAPIYIDDEPFTTTYIMRDGHLLVPALFLKNTGALVDWDDKYRSVVFKANGKMFALPVGKKFTDDYDSASNTWKRGTLSTETFEFNGKPYVPLVDVAVKLGMNVKYDSSVNRTYITSNIILKPITVKAANTDEKLVALTFDDGPEDYYTPQILDILKEKGVPATFFVMGQEVKAYPNIMKRIVNEGHAIGNHTFTHPDLKTQWSSKVKSEIQSTQQEMQKTVGRVPDIFRPPYGSYTKADLSILNQLGMRVILWSVDTNDWSGASAEQILEAVHKNVSPGAIILQHNFQYGRLLDGTVEALPKIIDDLQKEGYTFVTIQTLLNR